MLNQLSIKNFAIIDNLDISLKQGMSVITGETGAGKSIAIDALGLTLGDRAEAGVVKHGAKRSDITAVFEVKNNPLALAWLEEHELDEDDVCILRRTISSSGGSKAYINGSPATLQQIKTLGELLIDIHSQHQHQSLLRSDTHRRLLDSYGQCTELAASV
ncbi:MAG: AAA family ATPase, partial [Gammaproteobacteria bacterium]|nr:AAA family ATPase [Gammaproteobacteria bacterium]